MRGAWAKVSVSVAAAAGLYRLVLRPRQMRWGATDEEVVARLPGDERIAEPATQVTRAVTVEAPPEEVWPWVVQLGADRAGFYSYDWLENLFGLGIHSANVVVEGWQQRAVGDLVAAEAGGSAGWYVVELRPDELLVLQMADMLRGQPTRRGDGLGWEFLWTFALRPGDHGTTRLVVRERVGFGNTLGRLLLGPLGLVSFVMTRKLLIGVKARAEAAHRVGRAPGPKRPHGLARVALRAPAQLYCWHLGGLLGGRFVLLEHRGRRTGELRRTVLEVVDHDETFTWVVVCAAWGERSDWYRNVVAHDHVSFVTGGVHRCGIARRLDRYEATAALGHYAQQHPRAIRALGRRFVSDGEPRASAVATADRLAEVLPVVELSVPRGPHPSR